MGKKNTNYTDGLKILKLENLKRRREQLCLRFAKNCLKNEKVRNMFPNNQSLHKMEKRKN